MTLTLLSKSLNSRVYCIGFFPIMEFTVSKADLVRELSLSQGVVEKKTTIPILSNILLEAHGDRITLTATDLELGIRCSCPARVKKEGAGNIFFLSLQCL